MRSSSSDRQAGAGILRRRTLDYCRMYGPGSWALNCRERRRGKRTEGQWIQAKELCRMATSGLSIKVFLLEANPRTYIYLVLPTTAPKFSRLYTLVGEKPPLGIVASSSRSTLGLLQQSSNHRPLQNPSTSYTSTVSPDPVHPGPLPLSSAMNSPSHTTTNSGTRHTNSTSHPHFRKQPSTLIRHAPCWPSFSSSHQMTDRETPLPPLPSPSSSHPHSHCILLSPPVNT
jgi:hypothetical protein